MSPFVAVGHYCLSLKITPEQTWSNNWNALRETEQLGLVEFEPPKCNDAYAPLIGSSDSKARVLFLAVQWWSVDLRFVRLECKSKASQSSKSKSEA